MTRNRALLALAVVVALASSALGGCGGREAAGSAASAGAGSDKRFDLSGTTIRVGTSQEQTLGLGFSYALETLQGWGARVERENLTNVSGLEAIVAKRIDIAARSSDELITGVSKGVDVQAIGATVSTMHYAFIAHSDIGDLAALRGKQIAISAPGGFDTLLIRALLRRQGLDPDRDTALVPIGGSSERAAALLANQVSAAVVFMDNWFALRRQSRELRLLGFMEELLPGLSAQAIFAERGYLERNPQLATAIACANLEANRWIATNRQAFITFATERVRGANQDAVAEFYDAAARVGLYPTDPDRVLTISSYQATAKLMLEQGVISEPVDAARVVNTSYLREASARGCGA